MYKKERYIWSSIILINPVMADYSTFLSRKKLSGSVIGSRFLLPDLNSKVKIEQTVNVYPIVFVKERTEVSCLLCKLISLALKIL